MEQIYELDLKDRKILYELEQDSRQSLNEIAKKVRLKKETVFHRIKNLEKQGIIKKYLLEINSYKMGYEFYSILLRYKDTTPNIEEKIYNFLKNNKNVGWLTKCEGAWDINLTVITKGNLKLKDFLDELITKFGDYISDKQIFTTTELTYFKRGFWLDKPHTKTITTGTSDIAEIKEADYKLIRILSNDARKPLVDIGNILKTDAKNVAYKIKKYEKEGIIQGSKILVDFTKIGYKFYKTYFSLKNTNEEKIKKLFEFLQNSKNIIWATKMIGSYDLSIEMEVKDTEEFRKILDNLKLNFSDIINKHESLLVFEEAVLNYLPY
ncbi:MAG: Lrp/AsnC family transcriptional regulator [Candidatus Pacearchaeota archaeon]